MRIFDPGWAASTAIADRFPDATFTTTPDYDGRCDAAILQGLEFSDDPEGDVERACLSVRADGLVLAHITRGPGIRVLRPNDVAELLHAHGDILELGQTDDGNTLAAMRPRDRRGTVAVWTGHAIGPWHPSDIVQRGLGGSETAAWRLAEEMARAGFAVTLYGHFEQEGLVDDVILRNFQSFDPTRPLDAFIGFRDATRFDRRPNAAATFLWLEDLPGQERLTPDRARNIDHIVGVSQWHRQATLAAYPWLTHDHVVAGRNGIHHPYFDGAAPERERRVVYTSSPDRGLDILLEVWPQIRELVPDAELVSTYSRWYDLCADRFPQGFAHRERLIGLLDQPGVTRLPGGLGQRDLAHLMRTAMVWAHPSWYSGGDMEFHETSCISAMEAQAAGCRVVASNWGALTETVRHGRLIDGDPREVGGEWRNRFVDAIVTGLTDPHTQAIAQDRGTEAVTDMHWSGAAIQLIKLFKTPVPA